MISLTIDDREIEVADGSTILEAAEAAGVYIPTFCYHKRLMPFGACRMCVVEVEQMKGLGPPLLHARRQRHGGEHQHPRGEKRPQNPA